MKETRWVKLSLLLDPLMLVEGTNFKHEEGNQNVRSNNKVGQIAEEVHT